MKKRTISMGLAAMMALSLAGCGGSGTSAETTAQPAETKTAETAAGSVL